MVECTLGGAYCPQLDFNLVDRATISIASLYIEEQYRV